MKKILILFCALLFLFSCKKEHDSGKLKVIATNFPLYDFAREVSGDLASVKMLAHGHHYEPSPKDIIAIQNADIFLYIGGESDEWVKKILNTTLNSQLSTLNFLEQEESEEHHDHEEEYDEHIWTNPMNAISMVKKIAAAFGEKDTANKAFYVTRAAEYITKLIELDSAFVAITKNAKHKTIIFGDRFPFKHFAEEYGLEYHSAFSGCSHETEPSAASVASLIDKVHAENIPVIFHTELSNENIANSIATSTGAKKMLFHSVHYVSESNENYLSLMWKNVSALNAALSQ